MQMNLGGPVWHASAASTGKSLIGLPKLEQYALEALQAVGDSNLGQWIERGIIAAHVRRRLSVAEEALVGPVVDIRQNAAEVAARLRAVQQLGIVPMTWKE